MKRVMLIAALVLPIFLSAQQVAKSLTSSGKTIGFYEYKPTNYSTGSTKYPLIIFLHGIAERGNGTTELPKVKLQGIPKNIAAGHTMTFTWNGKTETFLVLSPQCSKADSFWLPVYIDAMLDYAKANLHIDTNRIFLTGLSMGGGGTWGYTSASVANAQKFAGIAPICGPCLMSNGSNIAASRTAVYAFHALDDREFWAPPSCTIRAIDSINKYNPVNKAIATYYSTGGHAIWPKAYDTTYAYQNPSLYEWFLSQNRSVAPNVYPIANAGNDTVIQVSPGTATLKGTLSQDPDGSVIRHFWRKVSGPASGTLTNAATSIATVTGQTLPGIYRFELKVVDNRANWKFDTMSVIVNAPPVSKAGADILVTLPINTATLNGTTSTDADGTIATYKWSKVSGPSTYALTNSSAASTTVTKLVKGTYKFKLTVTDNWGATGTDEVTLIVNVAPVAKAGADSTIHLPRTSTVLKGSGSTDSDGTIASYAWSRISGPSTYVIDSPKIANTNLRNLVAGTYKFKLVVKDNRGASGADTVVIIVNKLPIAKAGSDSTITLPRNYTTLRGTGSSDPDGTISTYLWSRVSGPTTFTIQTPTAATTSLTNLVQGEYQFKLAVTDNRGASTNDTVKVTVNAGGATAFIDVAVSEEPESIESFEVNPTLVKNAVVVRLSSTYRGNLIFAFYTSNGQRVKSVTGNKVGRTLTTSIDVNELPAGIYHLEVRKANGERLIKKIIKQ